MARPNPSQDTLIEDLRNDSTGTLVEPITRINRICTEVLSDTKNDQIVSELQRECSTNANISTKLAQDAGQYIKEVPIPPEYQRHAKVFSEMVAQQFPLSRPWDHAIELTEGAPKAIDCKIYPITAGEDEKLQEFIKEQRAKGYIQPSKSPYASPFFFVKKKDGKLCPVQDYRKLNEYTIKDKYPLPLIPDLITEVQDAWIFSKFNIRWGYNNVQIVTDVPRGSVKHVRFSGDAAIQDLRERAEKILAIRESEELAEEAVRLGRMVSSDAPLY